jgi:hypothetical protein
MWAIATGTSPNGIWQASWRIQICQGVDLSH